MMLIDPTSGTSVILIFITALLGLISIHLISNIWSPLLNDEIQSKQLQLNTCVRCSDGLCYLPMFETRHHVRMVARLGHFPTIIALASIPSSYRRRIKGKLTLIEDGVGHFERDMSERLVWEVVDELICRLDFVGSRQMRIVSSQPPMGYRYSELFLPEYRNEIIYQLGSFPRLQVVVDINMEYRTEFIGLLWQMERNKFLLEKVLFTDVWAQLGGWEIRPEATID